MTLIQEWIKKMYIWDDMQVISCTLSSTSVSTYDESVDIYTATVAWTYLFKWQVYEPGSQWGSEAVVTTSAWVNIGSWYCWDRWVTVDIEKKFHMDVWDKIHVKTTRWSYWSWWIRNMTLVRYW